MTGPVIVSENLGRARARTWFAGVTRKGAMIVLVLVGIFMGLCLRAAGRERLARPDLKGQAGDLVLYQTIVKRVHAGEAYYKVMAEELRAQGYGMQSVFNWRTPMLTLFLAKVLPTPEWGRFVMAGIALGTIVLVRLVTREMGGWGMRLGVPIVLFYAGLIACFARDGFYFSEMWGGLFIVLSATLYAMGWRLSAIGVGVLALFSRELAGIYVVVCLAIGVWEKRWKEIAFWMIGLAGYAIYYAVHVMRVHEVRLASDAGDPRGWLEFGGLRFVMQTAWWSGVALKPPDWVIAVYFPVAILGLFALTGRWGWYATLTGVGYAVFFSVAGHEYNDYWGMIYCPVLAIGGAWGVVAMRDLFVVAFRPAA